MIPAKRDAATGGATFGATADAVFGASAAATVHATATNPAHTTIRIFVVLFFIRILYHMPCVTVASSVTKGLRASVAPLARCVRTFSNTTFSAWRT